MRGLILAAGLGERLRPLTLTRAKPALEFLNVPMLAFPYHWLNTLGLTDLTLNTHHLPDTVRAAAMHVGDPAVHLHFTFEPTILGSGGGIGQARVHLTGERTFAVANGDAVVLFERPDTLRRMLEFHEQRGALATLLTCPLAGVGEKIPGVWMTGGGEVRGFGKTSPAAGATCAHYASFMFLSDEIWREYPEGNSNILYDVLLPRIERGEKVYGYHVEDLRWFETGNAHDYLAAAESCLREWRDHTKIGRAVAEIVTRLSGSFGPLSDLNKLSLIADSAEVAPDASFDGFAVVGGGRDRRRSRAGPARRAAARGEACARHHAQRRRYFLRGLIAGDSGVATLAGTRTDAAPKFGSCSVSMKWLPARLRA